jgi:hypothetical protein
MYKYDTYKYDTIYCIEHLSKKHVGKWNVINNLYPCIYTTIEFSDKYLLDFLKIDIDSVNDITIVLEKEFVILSSIPNFFITKRMSEKKLYFLIDRVGDKYDWYNEYEENMMKNKEKQGKNLFSILFESLIYKNKTV